MENSKSDRPDKVTTVAIFDIDGCISNDRWRRGEMPAEKSAGDWEHYHSGFAIDEPCNMDKVLEQHDAGHAIAFFTGRPIKHEAETAKWLRGNIPKEVRKAGCTFSMRQEGTTATSPVLKSEMVRSFEQDAKFEIVIAFDDRQDVIEMYQRRGIAAHILRVPEPKAVKVQKQEAAEIGTAETLERMAEITKIGTAETLERMAATYRERNAIYSDNYKNVVAVIGALFPGGVPEGLVMTEKWHLFRSALIKLTRFANTGLTHADSIHDLGVYSAMIESAIKEEQDG